MKALLLIPQRYSFHDSFKEAFAQMGGEVYSVDYYNIVKSWEQKLNTQIFRLPQKYRLKWESYYFRKINKFYIDTYDRFQPGIVLVYNNELLLPETLKYFKKKGTKIGFYLGDSPFFTPTNQYNLQLLEHADAIFSPDSFWISQLQRIGFQNLHQIYPSIPAKQYYKKELKPEVYNKLKTDVLYVGMSYTDSWGYKKAKFLNHFTDHHLHIIGNQDWKRWFKDFPSLEQYYTERKDYLSIEKLNDLFNATKIIPIDGNPGIMHGVHWRMMEALCSGALPLMEWQKDLYEIFPQNSDLPVVHSYYEIKDMVRSFLKNEKERLEIVDWMRQIVSEKYSVENNADRLDNALQLTSGG